MVMEGNELEKQFGKSGAVVLDVNASGIATAKIDWAEGGTKAGIFVEVDVMSILEKLAASTDNKIDDAMVSMIKGALGR